MFQGDWHTAIFGQPFHDPECSCLDSDRWDEFDDFDTDAFDEWCDEEELNESDFVEEEFGETDEFTGWN